MLALVLSFFSFNSSTTEAVTTKIAFVDVEKGSTLNVRSSASTKAKKIGSLKDGASVVVYSQTKSGWSEIRYKNKKAFVSTKYLNFSKVYPVYYLSEDYKKFPKKLPNGLTIGKENWSGLGYVPSILKGKKKVWRSLKEPIINTGGKVQFTVTKNKDTFLYYYSGASGAASVVLVGVHSDGKVFLNKHYGDGAGVDLKFLEADKVEIAVERDNENWNPAIDGNAARHTGIWDVKQYTISKTGKMKLVKKYMKKTEIFN